MILFYHLQSSASGHKRHNFLDGFLSKYHMRHFLKHFDCKKVLIQYPGDWLEDPGFTNIFVPGYLGIMVTRQQQFCCIFAATKDKFDYFLKKLFHSSTSHTYHHNSSLFLNRHKNIHDGQHDTRLSSERKSIQNRLRDMNFENIFRYDEKSSLLGVIRYFRSIEVHQISTPISWFSDSD